MKPPIKVRREIVRDFKTGKSISEIVVKSNGLSHWDVQHIIRDAMNGAFSVDAHVERHEHF